MNEPGNHTAWVDRGGDTWVRFDEWPAAAWGSEPWGPWVPLTDGPGWEPQARDGVGTPRPWHQVDGFHDPAGPGGSGPGGACFGAGPVRSRTVTQAGRRVRAGYGAP